MENKIPDQSKSKESSPEFTNEDLKSAHSYSIGAVDPQKLTPQNMESIKQEWYSSKIVKFGASFLGLVWAIYIVSQYRWTGLAALILVLGGVAASYKWYRKTKSQLAWWILTALLSLVVLFMVFVSRSKG